MKKKLIMSVLTFVLASSMLAGCTDQQELNELKKIDSLNSTTTSNSSSYTLSWTDEQSMIYAQVSDRTLLDVSALEACSDNELQQVINYMDNVDNQLTGQVSSKEGVIDEYFVNYLLSEFEKTPYYWQRSSMTIRGLDSESRAIVVDVTYKTIGFNKTIEPDTTIPRGINGYDIIVKNRYDLWVKILGLKKQPNNTEWPKLMEEFKTYYGDPEVIIAAQNSDSLSKYIYEKGNQKTYNCLVDHDTEGVGATMKVRYVLVPNYVLGLNMGLNCEHMYVLSYNVDNDFTSNLNLFTETGYQTIADNVYQLIYSYFTCIDECDFDGLYKLTSDFGKWDKFYEDKFDTTYTKHNGFSVSLFNIQGTHLTCGVTVSSKVRAKGSNMTFPSYTDRYYVEIDLIDESLQVTDMELLSRTIEGEPAIVAKEADLTGFSAKIDLDNDDKVQIEQLIRDFSKLQILQDTKSEEFSNVVDLALSNNSLAQLQSNMTSIGGVNKAVWLENYQQGTSNYASVRCKEAFQDASNAITEATVTYEFIVKGGRWYVYAYTVNSAVRLTSTTLPTTSSLCVIENGKVISFTSQLKNTTNTNLDNITNNAITKDYEAYTPTLKDKGATQQQGYALFKSEDVDEEVFNSMMETYYPNRGLNYQTWKMFTRDVAEFYTEEFAEQIDKIMQDSTAYLYNSLHGRFNSYDATYISNVRTEIVDQQKEIMPVFYAEEKSFEKFAGYDTMYNYLLGVKSLIEKH